MPSDRYRAILFGGGFAGLSKIVSLVTVAASVPLTAGYLGPERYGLWMTISSLIAFLSFADMGIGGGLVTALSSSATDFSVRAQLISSAYYMLIIVAVILGCTFSLAYVVVPWSQVFGVATADAVSEAGPGLFAFVACFIVGLPFTVVQRMQVGLQESWLANLWLTGASIVSLACVMLAAHRHAGVPLLVVAMNGGPVLVAMLNTAVEFRFRRPMLRPRMAMCNYHILRGLLSSSAMFVALQLCAVFGTASDSIIISRMFGAAAVGPYSVTFKLFQTTMIFSLFMYPLWPAFGDAIAKGDLAWARGALRKAVIFSLSFGVMMAVVLLAFGRAIIHAWVGDGMLPGFALISAFSVWIVLAAYGGALTTLLNNSQFLKLQVKIYAFASVFALALKFPLALLFGPAGVVWATVIAYSIGYCLPAGIATRRLFTAHA